MSSSSSNINDTGAIQALLDQLRSSEAWQRAVAATNAVGGTTQNDAGGSTAPAPTPAPAPETYSGSANALTRTYPTAPSSQAHGSSAGLEASTSHPTTTGATTGGSIAPPGAHPVPPNAQSVASLLSQLQASSTFAAVAGPSTGATASLNTPGFRRPAFAPPPAGIPDFPGPDAALFHSTPPGMAACIGTGTTTTASATTPGALAPRDPTPRQDLRACTFQQALPHLARLSEDEGFLKALAAMRAEQADMERQLWKERREIQRKHEERVKTARTKASIIGAGLTQYEADALTDSFRAELAKFDRERILPAWDGLLTKQQAALESLGVPAMFPTAQQADRERQQEIMQVLGRIVKNEGSHTTRSPGRDG
ncbi:hypothetical protein C8Q73DRAFT_694767 [Cubamyces lactineus]|nr:hypothetical protein C8Q73DRAFT_694767 [Cubamyces lactineus]